MKKIEVYISNRNLVIFDTEAIKYVEEIFEEYLYDCHFSSRNAFMLVGNKGDQLEILWSLTRKFEVVFK